MHLTIKIFTGDTTEKYLQKLKSRTGFMIGEVTEHQENPVISRVSDSQVSTGHTFKKMIESYEKNL